MRRLLILCGVLACAAAGPASKPGGVPARPASQPATAPARADPKFVEDFNERLTDAVRDGKAEFVEVIARLRERGALAGEPKLTSDGGAGKFKSYSVQLDYAWEYAEYSFR